jgi:hypothetical protein
LIQKALASEIVPAWTFEGSSVEAAPSRIHAAIAGTLGMHGMEPSLVGDTARVRARGIKSLLIFPSTTAAACSN